MARIQILNDFNDVRTMSSLVGHIYPHLAYFWTRIVSMDRYEPLDLSFIVIVHGFNEIRELGHILSIFHISLKRKKASVIF